MKIHSIMGGGRSRLNEFSLIQDGVLIPKNFRQYTSKIYGGCIPVLPEFFTFFREKNINTIITLTIMPFTPGTRNINHITHKDPALKSKSSEVWRDPCFVDIPNFSIKGFQLIHIPIADGFYPSPQALALLNRSINQSSGSVYIHCWAGKGRTRTAIYAHLLSQGMKYIFLRNEIDDAANSKILNRHQVKYLECFNGHIFRFCAFIHCIWLWFLIMMFFKWPNLNIHNTSTAQAIIEPYKVMK